MGFYLNKLLSHIFTTMKLELSSLLLLIVLLSPNVVDGKSDDDTFILLNCNEEFSHYEEKRTLVTCPSCSIEHCNTEVTVRGDVDNYAASSAICCSGIHHGVIGPQGGQMEVKRVEHNYWGWRIDGTTRNQITSQTFVVLRIHYVVNKTASTAATTATNTAPTTATTKATTTATTSATTTSRVITSTIASPTTATTKATTSSRVINATKATTTARQVPITVTTKVIAAGKAEVEPRIVLITSSLTTARADDDITSTNLAPTTLTISTWLVSGVAILIALLALVSSIVCGYIHCYAKKSSQQRQYGNLAREECVCLEMASVDESFGPETCERPCSIKEKLKKKFPANDEAFNCDDNCTSCDDKYAF